MHIVYVVADIEAVSGGPRVIIEHVNGLISRGHTVEIWTQDTVAKPYFNCDATVEVIEVDRLGEPDIVIVTDPSKVADVLSYRKNKKTFLLLQHDIEWVVEQNHGVNEVNRAGFTDTELLNYRDGKCEIIAVSTWLQERVKEKYGINAHCAINGVNSSVFHPTMRPSDRSRQVLMVYDPQPWKRFDDAYLAAHYAKQFIPDLKIAIIGRFMPPFPEKGGTYSSFTLPVTFFNRPEQNDLADIYSNSLVFVSASTLEGFGLPGLEAMACETALVTSDSGGPTDYAIDGETALVRPAGDIVALGEAIVKVLKDDALRKHLIQNGLSKASELTWSKTIDALESIFRQI